MALNALGSGSSGFKQPKVQEHGRDRNVLESFKNKNPHAKQWVRLICSEFTSLCPKTGQPDWAEICVNYIPDKKMVESKSLKLFLNSFRETGGFHEDVCCIIADDLFSLMQPHFLEVYGRFHPRGGIAIYPYVTRSKGRRWKGFEEQRILSFAQVETKGPVLK